MGGKYVPYDVQVGSSYGILYEGTVYVMVRKPAPHDFLRNPFLLDKEDTIETMAEVGDLHTYGTIDIYLRYLQY